MRRLFEGGAYSSNYCNWQLKSLLHLGQILITFRILLHLGQNVITFRTLLHLGQNVITLRTLLHLGPCITFRPCTASISLTVLGALQYHKHKSEKTDIFCFDGRHKFLHKYTTKRGH